MLTRTIASEYGGYNIQCNGIGPGYIATPQTAPLREEGHPFNSFIIAKTPAARWGTTEDLEGSGVFSHSSASDFCERTCSVRRRRYPRLYRQTTLVPSGTRDCAVCQVGTPGRHGHRNKHSCHTRLSRRSDLPSGTRDWRFAPGTPGRHGNRIDSCQPGVAAATAFRHTE